jgi:hypothetical protein
MATPKAWLSGPIAVVTLPSALKVRSREPSGCTGPGRTYPGQSGRRRKWPPPSSPTPPGATTCHRADSLWPPTSGVAGVSTERGLVPEQAGHRPNRGCLVDRPPHRAGPAPEGHRTGPGRSVCDAAGPRRSWGPTAPREDCADRPHYVVEGVRGRRATWIPGGESGPGGRSPCP